MNRYLLGVILTLGVLLAQGSLSLEAGPAAKEVSQRQNTSQPRGMLEATKFHGSLMGMQYEPWFTPGNANWDTGEAIPMLGKYSSYDVSIIRKHAEWFNEQINHAESCGMWSWMDGTIRQLVTYHEGSPEETVVTPSCFARGGWLAATATGRDHGVPYIESWKVAFETRPKFIQIHQWNEFAGQKEGQGFPANYWGEPAEMSSSGQRPSNVYADEYNLELSDDIEPVQMDKCAYRGCGDWGYYYLNLTKAILSLYRGATPDITVMTLSGPFQPAAVKEKELVLKWEILGKKPSTFTVQVDGKVVADHLQGQSYPLSLTGVPAGKHRVTTIADGAHTYFDLSPAKLASRSSKPLPVASTIEFTCAADRGRE